MTADITPENVARMLEGVTPGPWKATCSIIHGKQYGGFWVEGPDEDDGEGNMCPAMIPISGSGGARSYTREVVAEQIHDHNDANARFIAWAREAVPALAARLAEVEAERDGLLLAAHDNHEADKRAAAAEAENARLAAELGELRRDFYSVKERLAEYDRAAIKGEAPTEYEVKLAQLKKDFPNGI
jgi:hypothetical protein